MRLKLFECCGNSSKSVIVKRETRTLSSTPQSRYWQKGWLDHQGGSASDAMQSSWKRKQALNLRFGEDPSSRHGNCLTWNVVLATVRTPAGTRSRRTICPKLMRWTAPERHRYAELGAVEAMGKREPSTMEISTIGLDIAKRFFQVPGADARGKGQLRRHLQRADVLTFFASLLPCPLGIEACGTAHYSGPRDFGHWASK